MKCQQVYSDDIIMDVTDNNLDRKFRLQRVLGYMTAIDEGVCSKIKKLVNEKDTLQIYWKTHPSEVNKNSAKNAWMSTIGDGCSNVEHYSCIGDDNEKKSANQ